MTRTQQHTIAVLTDAHAGAPSPIPQRRSDITDLLLKRAVKRLNRLHRPDVTVVLGDLIDAGNAPDAEEELDAVKSILDALESPLLAIPGNHDPEPERFYRVFDRPAPVLDIGGVRFLSFIDPERPGYNAERSEVDMARFKVARAEFDGPIVALQHVCLFPEGGADIPYNYVNAPSVIAAMEAAGVCLSISGHYHPGAQPIRTSGSTFVHAPSICEAPFRYVLVTLSGLKAAPDISVEVHQLAMPETPALVDRHVHTELAYCAEDAEVARAIPLAQDFGLAGIGFAEHSGQLYFPAERYWNGACLEAGMAGFDDSESRMEAYRSLAGKHRSGSVRFGLEIDCDFSGRPLIRSADLEFSDFTIGSIHELPEAFRRKQRGDRSFTSADLADEFLGLLQKLLTAGAGVDILAHPFRLFRRIGGAPERLFGPVTELLRRTNTAAEINFHINSPPVEFVQRCLGEGVRFSFGSDAHRLEEIGEFAEHLALLEAAGFDGELSEVLFSPR